MKKPPPERRRPTLNVSILIFQVSLPELAPLLSAVAGLITGRSLEPLLISKIYIVTTRLYLYLCSLSIINIPIVLIG